MVYFILIRGKDRSFTFWFPEDRVIEQVSSNPHTYRSLFLCQAKCLGIKSDSASLAQLLKTANVDFSLSKPRKTTKEYYINSKLGDIKVDVLDSLIVFKSISSFEKNCDCLP